MSRECLNEDGTSKRSYPTSALAKDAARKMRRSRANRLPAWRVRPYRCGDCGSYHVGHASPGSERAR